MWCKLIVQFLFIGSLFSNTATAGVFPNYHAHFDFIEWDKEQTPDKLDAAKHWWETAAFYQIYPRSFKDSNADGVGDLKGITDQLPYLKEIGITATWLSPIFTSPMADFGYDIANFTEIDPIFGTMADMDGLLARAKELGLKIILDFVPNHSSDECKWFKLSAQRDPEYKDFYVWHPGKIINGSRYPPSNWISVFRGSAWQWHPGRQEYYLHQFVSKQPDLNYRNPKVRQTMSDVLRFWLNKGVAGFRIDAVPHVFEIAPDAEGNFPDEPRNPAVNDPDDFAYVKHIYTVDQPETIDLIYEWRKVLDDFQRENGGEDRILMAESYSPIDIVMKYYGNGTVNGAQIPFNFLLIENLVNNSNAYDYKNTIDTWLHSMPSTRTANWVLGNHDKSRIGSRLGTNRIDMMNMLLLTLPGCSITYQGEEIGMTDVWISWEDTVDPAACNSNPSIYEQYSRDPVRTPFQWNDSKDSGFSVANKTWLPIAPNYKQVNVKMELGISLSHLNVYKALQQLRNESTLRHGNTELQALNNNVLAVKRSLLNDLTYITLININNYIENIDLGKVFTKLPAELQYVVVTDRSTATKGEHVKSNAIRLMPYEGVVLRSLTKLTTTVGYYTYYVSEGKH